MALNGPPRLAYGGVAIATRVAGVALDVSGSRMMDRVVRGRVWIGVIAFSLIGLVAMQVSMLKLNSGISRAAQTVTTLERSNSALRSQITSLSAGDRIQRLATASGLVMPAPGDIAYLRAGSLGEDAARAARRMRPPSPLTVGLAGGPTPTGLQDVPAPPGAVTPQATTTPAPTTATTTTTAPATGGATTAAPATGTAAPVTAAPTGAATAPAARRRPGHAEHAGGGARRGRIRRRHAASNDAHTLVAQLWRRRPLRTMAGLTERRIGLLFAIFLGLLVLAAGRTLWLGGVRAEALQRAATTQQVDEIEIPARRGAISDRNGIELAVSEPAADVAATPYLVKRPLRAAARLAPLLGSTERKVLTKLSSESGFVYLARNLPASKAEKIKKLKIDGLQFIPSSRRNYPAKSLASQVLGGVGVDGEGQGGLEYRFDDVLRGTDGTRRIVKDALGDPIVLQETERAVAGKDLGLTLDAQLQGKVEDVLAEVGAKWRPKGATAVVMDPRTSTVLALANWPRVDANDFGSAPEYAGQNRAVGFNYEPGSTFKAFTVAAALEDKVVTPNDVFSLPPSITVADRTIEEAHERGGIDLTVSQILAQSSNVGTVKIGLKIGPDRFDHWVRRFGFGRPTGVELPGEERGQVLKRKQYSGSSMGNLPIGQGESVTPMQLTAAYAAIANDGVLRRPRIVASIGDRPTNGARRAARDLAAHRRAAAHDALRRRRGRRHRRRRRDRRLHARRQDRHRQQDRVEHRRVLQDALHRVVRRLRAGARPEAARDGHGRRAAGRDLRRLGGGTGVSGDHALRVALPAHRAGLRRPAASRVPVGRNILRASPRTDR